MDRVKAIKNLFFVPALVFGVLGCGDLASIPVPQPVPGALRQSIPDVDQDNILVVGLPGAVAGLGKVRIKDVNSEASVIVDSTGGGTFSAIVAKTAKNEFQVRFENDEGQSEWVLVPGLAAWSTVNLGPATNVLGPEVVSAPDSNGKVLVTNDGGAGQPPLLEATPNVDVIVVNATNGAMVESKTDGDGIFNVLINGSTGDLIHILLVDPTDRTMTSDYRSYEVPESS